MMKKLMKNRNESKKIKKEKDNQRKSKKIEIAETFSLPYLFTAIPRQVVESRPPLESTTAFIKITPQPVITSSILFIHL